MYKNHEGKVLHIGEIAFPIPWDDWFADVEKVIGWKLHKETRNDLGGGLSALNGYEIIRVSRSWANEAYTLFKASSPLMTMIHYVDLIYLKNGTFWPHLIHKEALHAAILERQPFLNTKGAGLIVGLSVEAILAAFVLVELGIKHITFVVENESDGQSLLGAMIQSLFEVHFEVISKDKVILLPGVYSVTICYEDLAQQADLLTALLYFNYLERGGLVINGGSPLEKVPLVEEALAIGAKVIDLPDLQVFEELMVLRKIQPFPQGVMQQLASLALKREFAPNK